MLVYITNENIADQVETFISDKTGLFHRAFEVLVTSEISKSKAGKTIIQYPS